MEALQTAFPEARRTGLGRCLGYSVPRAAQANVIAAKQASWWREASADEVLGAVVAERYGDQAR